MKMLPVVTRELGAIARRRSVYWMRSGAALAAFIALAYMSLIAMAGVPMPELGRNLLNILSYSAFAYALLAGVRGTSDALSEEKREGTLGLLFLTNLKGYDVVFGKFVSLSINSFYAILAIVPPLSLAFLLGGVSPEQLLMISAALLNTLFFSLAVGLCVSTFSHNERPAMGLTLAFVFLSVIGGFLICLAYLYNSEDIWNYLLPGFLLSSPLFAFMTAMDAALSQMLREEFWLSCAFTHLLGWLCLVIASICVRARAHAEAPKSRLAAIFARVRNRWAYGRAQHRTAIRSRLLDRNAFFWLAARDRLKRRYAWVFLSFLGGIAIFTRYKSPDVAGDWQVKLASLWFLHVFFKVWMASEVAARFIEDRRTNAVELLLTTPLSLAEFARGQRLALLRQFGGPIAVVLILDLLGAWSAEGSFRYAFNARESTQYYILGIVHLLADILVIQWVAMWRSFHLRGTNRTILQTIGIVVLIPILGLGALWQGEWIYTIMTGAAFPTWINLLWRWTSLCLLYDALVAWFARRAFYRDFREAATSNFDKPAPSRLAFWRRNPEKNSTPKIKPKRLKRLAPRFAMAGFILCLGIVVAARLRSHRLEKIVEQRLASLRAQRMPLTPEEIRLWRPPASPRESGTLLLQSAYASFVHPPRGAGIGSYTASDRTLRTIPDEVRSNAVVFVRSNQRAYQILRELSSRKPDFPSSDLGMRRFVATEDLLGALRYKAILELDENSPAALQTISLILHYARVREGPGSIGSGRHALQFASALMERAAMLGGIPRAQWLEWKSILDQLNFPDKLRAQIIWERSEGLQYLTEPPDKLYQDFGRSLMNLPVLFNAALAVRHFVGQDFAEELYLLDHYDRALVYADKPYSEVAALRGVMNVRNPSLTSPYLIAPFLVPAFDSMFHFTTGTIAHQRLLQAAIEVELYRADHGELPRDANALGKTLPLDPFQNWPLRYQRTEAGYIIDIAPQTSPPRIGPDRHLVPYEGATFICGPREEKHKAGSR